METQSNNINAEDIEVWNIHDPFVPTQYEFKGYLDSWKQCRCGRICNMHDRYCGTCGQKLGFPDFPEEK